MREEDAWDVREWDARSMQEWDATELAESSAVISEWRSQRSMLFVKPWEIHFIDFLGHVNIVCWLEMQMMHAWQREHFSPFFSFHKQSGEWLCIRQISSSIDSNLRLMINFDFDSLYDDEAAIVEALCWERMKWYIINVEFELNQSLEKISWYNWK